MVVIAIDYGEKKIGLAVGNTETMTSSPISIVKKTKTGFNLDELKEKIMEWEPSRIIIGKPLNMDGTRSDFMKKVERFAKKLRSKIDIEIEFFDERLTSFEARQLDEDSEMIDDVAEIFSDRLTVKQGIFGALMEVSLINDGPLTMFIESRDGKIQS